MMKYVIVLCCLLSACASTAIVYNPLSVNSDQLATVTTQGSAKTLNSGYRAWVELVWDESEKEVTGRKPFFDRPIGEISLVGGKYTFKGSCNNGTIVFEPEAVFDLAPGKKYQLVCVVEKGKNIVGMSIDAYASIKIKEINKIK